MEKREDKRYDMTWEPRFRSRGSHSVFLFTCRALLSCLLSNIRAWSSDCVFRYSRSKCKCHCLLRVPQLQSTFACFPAVRQRVRVKKRIYKCLLFNNTCNWMLMSTEYSLQSCKEMSLCFSQFLVCVCARVFSYLDNLFCGYDSQPTETHTFFLFTYKFIILCSFLSIQQ